MEADRSFRKRVREHESDGLEFDWAEVKRLRDDLLDDGALDGEDGETGHNINNNTEFAATRDLDSVMRSLQKEITSGASSPSQGVNFIDLTYESGESPTELGFLLGASDDELGIPPSNNNNTNNSDSRNKVIIDLEADGDRVEHDSSELSELWSFGDPVPAYYDSFEFGCGERYEDSGVYETFDDELFVYPDLGVNAFDHTELWSRVSTNESFFETL